MSTDRELQRYSLEPRLDQYQSFYNHEWESEILALADPTKLGSVAYDLTVDLRATINTHAFPWFVTDAVSRLYKTIIAEQAALPRFLSLLEKELANRLDGKLTRMKQRQVTDEVRAMRGEFQQRLDGDDGQFASQQRIWEWFARSTELTDFHMAIWGSQRLVFGALFFTYEAFVKGTVAIAKNAPDYRGDWPRLVTDTKEQFGDQIGIDCLEGDFIDFSRYARHALAHSSGRETKKLREKPSHGLDVQHGKITVPACGQHHVVP